MEIGLPHLLYDEFIKARLEDARNKTHRLKKKAEKYGMKPDLLPPWILP